MTPDTLHAIATTLRRAYAELEAAKHAAGKIRDERTMRPGGRLGPASPGRPRPVELCMELELRLYDFVCDAKRFITPRRSFHKNWPELMDWILFNSEALAELDVADDLADELRWQRNQINRLLYPTPPRLNRPEPWRPARHVIALLRGQGHRITADQLRKLASRGLINSETNGRLNLYRTSEILEYLQTAPPERNAADQ